MKLNSPTKMVFWISTILAVLGIIAFFITIPFVSNFAIWFVVAGYVLLWLGNTMKGF